MVIDVDNHLNYGGGQTFHPVFMVYMAPQTNSGGNLLRTWNGSIWDESAWNWNVAYTYQYNSWYYAELEKKDNHIILRLYDENKNILEETTPVSLDKIFAMSTGEYLYLGEPHTDDYEGNVRIDEITLLLPDTGAIDCGDADESGILNILDVSYIILYLYKGGPAPLPNECIGDANGSGTINILDIAHIISFLYRGGPTPVTDCCNP